MTDCLRRCLNCQSTCYKKISFFFHNYEIQFHFPSCMLCDWHTFIIFNIDDLRKILGALLDELRLGLRTCWVWSRCANRLAMMFSRAFVILLFLLYIITSMMAWRPTQLPRPFSQKLVERRFKAISMCKVNQSCWSVDIC